MNIFISGVSSGIGLGLAKHYSEKGHQVYGVSRRRPEINSPNFHHAGLDLLNYARVENEVPSLIKGVKQFDLVVLNAGKLGEIQPMAKANLEELKSTMEMNLWSQKVLLDLLLKETEVKMAVAMSSGASVNGNVGWSGYSLSKAALNMFIQLYAKEFEATKFYAFAPGLVDTAMQDYLWDVSAERFPSVKKLHQARGTQNMPRPKEFAPKFEQAMEKLQERESGSFVDLRTI